MTSLDDALNQSSITYGPHQLRAYWRESDRADDGSINADTPTDLTQQSKGSFTVSHALNDALPDPVTMTGDGDASGVMKADLVGREGLDYSSSGVRAYNSGGGSWDSGAAVTTLTAPLPTGILRDDFVLAAILLNDATASIVPQMTDPKDNWVYLGVVSDSPLIMHVYCKRRWRTGNPVLTLAADKPVSYMSLSIAFWARNPSNMAMDYRVTDVTLQAEASNTTTHTVESQLLNRGYQVAFWGATSASGAITHTAPVVLHGTPSLNGLQVSGGITPITDAGVYTAQMTQAAANAVVCKVAVSVEPYERPRMDVRQYFSPFNTDSPVYGWDRDTADVEMDARVITEDGAVDTRLFTGQMQGIKISGSSPAQMDAVSRARISLNRSIPLPMVSGSRENCLVDWLVTYLMARGGSFVGPAPNRYTRYWAPLYGSLHAHWDTPQSYNAAYLRDNINPFLLFGLRNPKQVEGRWMAAMYGQQTSSRIEELLLLPRNMHQMSRDDFPHLYDDGASGPLMMDMMSLGNSRGRFQIWIRGDAVQSAPSYVVAGDDYILKMLMNLNDGGTNVCTVECGIASNTRNPYIRMGTTAAGTLSTSFVFGGLPTDGEWHYFGFWWDFAAGTGNVCFDGTVITANGWSTGGYNDVTGLPSTDAAGRTLGMVSTFSIKAHIPMSDVIVDFGETYTAGQWATFYPTPPSPGVNAVYLASYTKLNAIAEPTAVNAWETLGDLCRSVLANYRCDENDVFNFLPLEWFGRSPQADPVAELTTDTNAGELDVIVDPSKIRNVVTVKFPDTRVDTKPQPVLLYLSAIDLPMGLTQVTLPLDVPIVEIHGQAFQSGAEWTIVNLTSTQITTPTLPKTNHYITVNASQDGSGAVLATSSVSARIIQWDAGSVTVEFDNKTGALAYLVNNGDQVPFFQLLGYGVRISDAYVTVRDTDSVALRRERALDAEMPWLQTRGLATDYALLMTNILSRPIPLIKVSVVGDPQRKPGQKITLVDSQSTRVSGTWRVLSVDHNIDGPEYTQDLLLMLVGPTMIWDDTDTPWDYSVWG